MYLRAALVRIDINYTRSALDPLFSHLDFDVFHSRTKPKRNNGNMRGEWKNAHICAAFGDFLFLFYLLLDMIGNFAFIINENMNISRAAQEAIQI